MKDNRIYKKMGRRYIPMGMEYHNYLSDGIWYVRGDGHSLTLMASFKDLGEMPEQLTIVARMHAQAAIKAAQDHFKGSYCLYDLAVFIADYFAKGGK